MNNPGTSGSGKDRDKKGRKTSGLYLCEGGGDFCRNAPASAKLSGKCPRMPLFVRGWYIYTSGQKIGAFWGKFLKKGGSGSAENTVVDYVLRFSG